MGHDYRIPDPAKRRAAHVIWNEQAVVIAVPITEYVPLAGAQNARIYFKSDVAGVLKVEYVRPNADRAVYATGQPTAVTIVGGVENGIDVDASFGNAEILLTFTPGGNGVVNYCDVHFGYAY